jgi:hypothetical protein
MNLCVSSEHLVALTACMYAPHYLDFRFSSAFNRHSGPSKTQRHLYVRTVRHTSWAVGDLGCSMTWARKDRVHVHVRRRQSCCEFEVFDRNSACLVHVTAFSYSNPHTEAPTVNETYLAPGDRQVSGLLPRFVPCGIVFAFVALYAATLHVPHIIITFCACCLHWW